MADGCFSKPEVVIYQSWIKDMLIKFVDRFSSEDGDIVKYVTESSMEPPPS